MPKELNVRIDPKLIKAFVHSTEQILVTMADIACQIETPYFKTGVQATYDVSGIVGFSGEVAGSVAVSFSEETAMAVVEAFAGERIELGHEDFAGHFGSVEQPYLWI